MYSFLLIHCLATHDARIERLGSPSFRVRERATADLLAAGDAARWSVRAALSRQDQEIRHRAEIIWDRIRPTPVAVWVNYQDFYSYGDDVPVFWIAELNDYYPRIDHRIVAPTPGFEPGDLAVYVEGEMVFHQNVWGPYSMSGLYAPLIRSALLRK